MQNSLNKKTVNSYLMSGKSKASAKPKVTTATAKGTTAKAVTATNIKIEVVEDTKKVKKPKTSKVVVVQPPVENSEPLLNVILHLKCSSKDLNEYIQKNSSIASIAYVPDVPNIMTYNTIQGDSYTSYGDAKHVDNAYDSGDYVCKVCKQTDDEEISIKDINTKLKRLKVQLFKNSLLDKKSACFWCTYEYDSPACYIPKYETDSSIMAYGSFCRPECAVAYLIQENLDDSTKFERYQLLNQIYGKIYDYKRNIKPAPNPYYTLEKFYGALTIQEYRKLLKTDHMLLTIDKPMTRMLPELHEETDETILNVGKTTTGTYKVKRQSEKVAGPTKASMLLSAFGIE